MFFLPCLLWRFLNGRSGMNIAVIMEAAMASQRAVYAENREKTLRYTVHLLDRYLLVRREQKTGCTHRLKQKLSRYCLLFYSKFYGNYLTCSYMLIKLFYIGNAAGQLFLLDLILGYDFHMVGFNVISHLIMGSHWSESERFPRVTQCDFIIRQATNVHSYTFQCVLPINLFNEKIFIIVWFWLLFVAVTAILSVFQWLDKTLCWPKQVSLQIQWRHMSVMASQIPDNSIVFFYSLLKVRITAPLNSPLTADSPHKKASNT